MKLVIHDKNAYFRDKCRNMNTADRTSPVNNIVDEPQAFYQLESRFDRISSILGGQASMGFNIHSEFDLIEMTRKGLPTAVVRQISDLLNVSMEKMSELIHISHRTIQRKGDTDLLNVYSTEQIIEIAEVISRGIEVLGTVEAFTAWCHGELRHLNYNKPIDLLDTSFGASMVLDTLGRIEHGVYS